MATRLPAGGGSTAEATNRGHLNLHRESPESSQRSIWRGAAGKPGGDRLRHLAYAGGWKKFEPVWDALIRSRQVLRALPLLETTLNRFQR